MVRAAHDWLTARPFAHRGLHNERKGVIENTASAFSAAIAHGYGIECDVQISADGEAMVYHDDTLDRLTQGKGHLANTSAAVLKAIPFKHCTDHMLSLGELCDLVAGRVTLLIEMKSHFDHNPRLPRRVAGILRTYSGPAAVMSFDAEMIVTLRNAAPHVSLGLVAESGRRTMISSVSSQLTCLLNVYRARPQFIAYAVNDLPVLAPVFARYVLGMPLLAWTVRNETERLRSERWADQMIFEDFLP